MTRNHLVWNQISVAPSGSETYQPTTDRYARSHLQARQSPDAYVGEQCALKNHASPFQRFASAHCKLGEDPTHRLCWCHHAPVQKVHRLDHRCFPGWLSRNKRLNLRVGRPVYTTWSHTDGSEVRILFAEVQERSFRLSFDAPKDGCEHAR